MTGPAQQPGSESRKLWFGLSGKLLLLTIAFVMLTEVLVYVPTVANFRLNWLNDRLADARTAALVLEAAPSGTVSDVLTRQILDSAGAVAVAVKTGQQRRLLTLSYNLPPVAHEIDTRETSWATAVFDALGTLVSQEGDLLRVVGAAPMANGSLEIVVRERPLRDAMLAFSGRVLLLSLFISTVTAALVFLALNTLFVRPMQRMTASMMAFGQNPERVETRLKPSGRRDEIGLAERELAAMQADIASMLSQKSRLAGLGLAVSKISHDLRNLLASAQLFSERLAAIPEPAVQRFAPKLVLTLERAIAFCRSTLSYGKAQEPAPERHMMHLQVLVDDVAETLGLDAASPILCTTAIHPDLHVDADRDQLFRVLTNLLRNAMQALELDAQRGPKQIRVAGRREGAVVIMEVSDTGPGVSNKAREHLFEAFHASTRAGGVGLGLAIACEIVRAHGGDIRLVEGTLGATFSFTIPDRAVELAAHQKKRSPRVARSAS